MKFRYTVDECVERGLCCLCCEDPCSCETTEKKTIGRLTRETLLLEPYRARAKGKRR